MASTSRQPSEDAAEVKKALATGANSDQPVQLSAVPPVVCYCVASILMTLVNKVQPALNPF
ncbi:GDP-mannose transporter into the lumen of the Golgi [Marasmius crinis-equi]|uniref:GDP-mannose transporter into the lumen of the Golgi n=1 Tax=Marasmius crinis-equi TaxID=585013 RepID=A0ABR3FUT3_9AGAR